MLVSSNPLSGCWLHGCVYFVMEMHQIGHLEFVHFSGPLIKTSPRILSVTMSFGQCRLHTLQRGLSPQEDASPGLFLSKTTAGEEGCAELSFSAASHGSGSR